MLRPPHLLVFLCELCEFVRGTYITINLSEEDRTDHFLYDHQALYVNQTIFWLALYFAKISIVFFNRRLTALAQGWWKKGHWVVLGIIIACFILALFSTIFECQPVKAHYNMHALGSTLLEDPKRLHCVDSTKLELANRWLHVATDLMLLMVPLFILYRLQMPLRKKLSVGFLFCFGIICCVASIMRNEVWTHPSSDFTCKCPSHSPQTLQHHTENAYSRPSLTDDSRALLVWDLIDVNFAPIVACLPVYYPVVNFLFRDLKSRFTSLTHPGASTSSHKNASQNSQSSTNSVAKIKDRLFQGGHHQNAHVAAASEVQGIRGPYARADDEGGTELGAINVERGVTVTRDRKGSLFERPPRDFFEPEGTYHTAVQARR